MRVRLTVMVMAVTLAAGPAFAQDADAKLDAYKKEAVRGVDEMAKLAQEMVDSVFSFGELGLQEVETSRYLTGMLEKFGFKVHARRQSGIPTAWVATWGIGKPVIALGSDIDGIPQASQKPGVAYHDPIIEGAPGHGEGHNTGMPLNIVAAIAVKQIMERDKLPGTLMLWPGVAEELVASKAWFVRDGMFKDVDVDAVHARRQQPRRVVGRRRRHRAGVGRVHLRGRDRAQRRRAVARPLGARRRRADERRAGSTAASTCACRSARTTVITNGGDQPNVVPRNASIWFYFREIDQPHIKELWDIGNKMAEGAALMTNTKWTSRILGTAYPQHMNKAVAETMYANIQTVGLPTWSEADQTLAKALQKELGNPRQDGPGGEARRARQAGARSRTTYGGGSDDIGDISWNVPTVTLRYPVEHPRPARPQLVERHRQRHADRAQGRGRRRQGAGDDGARPADQAGAREERVGLLQQRPDQGREVHPVHHQGHAAADAPEHGRSSTKYREQMRKFYYDPTKYPTYLEQLGIKYPTVRKQEQE